MSTPTTYTLTNSDYTAFWNTHHEAFKARIATRNHLQTQARIIRERGGQIKKADRHMTAETYAHLNTQAAIIRSQTWRYPTLVAQVCEEMATDDSGWGDPGYEITGCKGCDDPHELLMHNCT